VDPLSAKSETIATSMPHADLAGLKLYYERAGSGEPELLFVHGWCCDHTAFQPQLDHFAARHAVTALDLRGCGQSDAPEGGYGIRDFADDVAQFCGVVGIERPVVVGHSLGGMIAVELGARYPALPSALVLLDPGPIDPLPETVKHFAAAAEQLAGPAGEDVRQAWIADMGARDEELARWIVELMSATPLPIAAAAIRGLNDWNGVGALGLCVVPTLLVRPGLGSSPDVPRLRKIKPDLALGITVGAGHFHHLEVPQQVNAMIERFLAVSL
jgi:pimeloyl-ACP methyl ester carboxylesterase